jgi:hypothetical protein
LRRRNLSGNLSATTLPAVGHNESVAEENAEQAVRNYRHAGLDDLLEFFGGNVFGDDLLSVGDEVDAVACVRRG